MHINSNTVYIGENNEIRSVYNEMNHLDKNVINSDQTLKRHRQRQAENNFITGLNHSQDFLTIENKQDIVLA